VTASAVIERRSAVAPPAAPDGRAVLPAWPLVAMVAGYPVEWALGATAFASLGIALVMGVFLIVRGRFRRATGLLPWGALLLWVLACAVGVHAVPQAIGYAQRLGDLVAAGVAGLYYMNARERIPARTAVAALVWLWVVTVILGFAAIAMPTLHLQTPVSFLIPDGLKSNSLVSQLIYPPMAEVQQPWGASVPFNRPAAPFPYANSWGAAYAILTPVVLAYLALRPARPVRWALGVLLVLSLYPAIQTSNRGMFLGLGIAVAYFVVRLALRGRVLATVGAATAVAVAAAYLIASGSLQSILDRQQVSDSTGTRAGLYEGTLSATLQSPFLGWASPQTDVSIGYPLGSQGQAWTLMYSYGFVGLGLFLAFLLGAVALTARAPSTAALWLHASLVLLVPLVWLYGLGTAQTISMVVVAAILLRARECREVLA
jgi:antibiotic biosynthesis monooxygenase (ABM) superfamily enzyme